MPVAIDEGSRPPEAAGSEGLIDRVFSSILATYDVFSIYIGERLGLYAALDGGAATVQELASATATDERYVREWLEHQATTGILGASGTVEDMTFSIPAEHRDVLLAADSPDYLAGLVRFTAGTLSIMRGSPPSLSNGSLSAWPRPCEPRRRMVFSPSS